MTPKLYKDPEVVLQNVHKCKFTRKWLVVFGGFHDNLRDSKYFNDVHAFDLETRAWSKLSTTGSEPSPR